VARADSPPPVLVNRCPLFLYTDGRVRQMLAQAGVERFDWVELDRDYLVVAHLG
jgi:hypothetical protein